MAHVGYKRNVLGNQIDLGRIDTRDWDPSGKTSGLPTGASQTDLIKSPPPGGDPRTTLNLNVQRNALEIDTRHSQRVAFKPDAVTNPAFNKLQEEALRRVATKAGFKGTAAAASAGGLVAMLGWLGTLLRASTPAALASIVPSTTPQRQPGELLYGWKNPPDIPKPQNEWRHAFVAEAPVRQAEIDYARDRREWVNEFRSSPEVQLWLAAIEAELLDRFSKNELSPDLQQLVDAAYQQAEALLEENEKAQLSKPWVPAQDLDAPGRNDTLREKTPVEVDHAELNPGGASLDRATKKTYTEPPFPRSPLVFTEPDFAQRRKPTLANEVELDRLPAMLPELTQEEINLATGGAWVRVPKGPWVADLYEMGIDLRQKDGTVWFRPTDIRASGESPEDEDPSAKRREELGGTPSIDIAGWQAWKRNKTNREREIVGPEGGPAYEQLLQIKLLSSFPKDAEGTQEGDRIAKDYVQSLAYEAALNIWQAEQKRGDLDTLVERLKANLNDQLSRLGLSNTEPKNKTSESGSGDPGEEAWNKALPRVQKLSTKPKEFEATFKGAFREKTKKLDGKKLSNNAKFIAYDPNSEANVFSKANRERASNFLRLAAEAKIEKVKQLGRNESELQAFLSGSLAGHLAAVYVESSPLDTSSDRQLAEREQREGQAFVLKKTGEVDTLLRSAGIDENTRARLKETFRDGLKKHLHHALDAKNTADRFLKMSDPSQAAYLAGGVGDQGSVGAELYAFITKSLANRLATRCIEGLPHTYLRANYAQVQKRLEKDEFITNRKGELRSLLKAAGASPDIVKNLPEVFGTSLGGALRQAYMNSPTRRGVLEADRRRQKELKDFRARLRANREQGWLKQFETKSNELSLSVKQLWMGAEDLVDYGFFISQGQTRIREMPARYWDPSAPDLFLEQGQKVLKVVKQQLQQSATRMEKAKDEDLEMYNGAHDEIELLVQQSAAIYVAFSQMRDNFNALAQVETTNLEVARRRAAYQDAMRELKKIVAPYQSTFDVSVNSLRRSTGYDD